MNIASEADLRALEERFLKPDKVVMIDIKTTGDLIQALQATIAFSRTLLKMKSAGEEGTVTIIAENYKDYLDTWLKLQAVQTFCYFWFSTWGAAKSARMEALFGDGRYPTVEQALRRIEQYCLDVSRAEQDLIHLPDLPNV